MSIAAIPDFGLGRPGPLSDLMRARGIRTFHAAAALVRDLPYRRPRAAGDLAAVLAEGCGTCSSKHALLAALALEQGVAGIELVLGLYEMREENTPGVAAALAAHGLSSVPEAHCYLRCAGRRVDLTGLPAGPESPFDALLSEEPVEPARLAAVKGPRHRAFIERWAADRGLDPARVWEARERCIAAIAGAWPAGVVFSENGRVDVAQLTLTDGSGIAGFYERFGFRDSRDRAKAWERAPAGEGPAAPGT